MAGLTETIACFVVNTPSQAVPAEATEKAKKVIADTVGVILAGRASDLAPSLLRYVTQAERGGTSPILGTGIKSTPALAAMANGTLGHALDFDDVLPLSQGHPSVTVLSALIGGIDGREASGKALIEAYVFGIEIASKIGVGMAQSHYDRGWHPTGTIGIFGAAAGVARLLQMDVPTTRQAIGIACSMASGLRRNFGTMTKPLHSGWAARNGLTACQLAQAGITAALDALEAKSGFFTTFGDEHASTERCAEQLGRPFAAVDPGSSLKRYPCCYAVHRALDGVLSLRQQYNLTPDNVGSVVCTVPPSCLIPMIYPRPETGLQGKFSTPYTVAAAILDGKLNLATFTDEAVRRPEIRELYPRIKIVEDPRVSPTDPLGKVESVATRGFMEVEVVTTRGETLTIRVDAPRGSPGKELTWDEIEDKFLDCASHGGVERGRAEKALEWLRSLEMRPRVSELLELLQ